MKPSKVLDEICYPFIHETACLCDFEVVTDEWCTQLGMALSATPAELVDIAADLDHLQPLAFHVNGSIRGKLAVEEADVQWVLERMAHYRQELGPREHAFVLPRGTAPVPQLHQARSGAKKAIRAMVRVEQEGREVAAVLPRFCNAVCNLLFLMTLAVNLRRGVQEVAFVSKSYKVH
ncbi:MAG: ATP--cob(I)alamin adenosyltransferase [Comamonas sp.]|nr:ATP--cob(I)alamin adenosyltransferase [Comamonas sp.]